MKKEVNGEYTLCLRSLVMETFLSPTEGTQQHKASPLVKICILRHARKCLGIQTHNMSKLGIIVPL